MTLENYFRKCWGNQIIDHALRCEVRANGTVKFYIHPATVSGDTLDFIVAGNVLAKDPLVMSEADMREERALDALIVAAMRGIEPDKLSEATEAARKENLLYTGVAGNVLPETLGASIPIQHTPPKSGETNEQSAAKHEK